MTSQSDTAPEYSIANLTSVEQNLLALVPDEEQRSVLYRELLRKHGVEPPYTDLSVAENVLTYEYLSENVFKGLPALPEGYTRYHTSYGTDELRDKMAIRLGQSFGVTVDPNDVFGTAGVSSALQSIALGLQQPLPVQVQGLVPVPAGSTVLLPAPFWQGFHWSFEQVPQLRCVPVNLTAEGPEKFQLTLEDLKRTYKCTKETKYPAKLLVLTNPHNPLGVNYDKSLLESIYEWALRETDMHIISDEMYCHSQRIGAEPKFVSALNLKATNSDPERRERVHVVWGFAKDFGLSGFRAGFVISKSKYVQNVMYGDSERHPLSWFTPFDSLKHFYILPIIAEKGEIWNGAMDRYKECLTESFDAAAKILRENGIKFFNSDSKSNANHAQFFWLNLREFLPYVSPRDSASALFNSRSPGDPDPEQTLAECILANAHVKLLTGTTLTCEWKGYFRLCFTAFEKQKVVEAVTKMCEYLKSLLPGS